MGKKSHPDMQANNFRLHLHRDVFDVNKKILS
jgi:hypothetical protein